MTTHETLCMHCKYAIKPDGHGHWIHVKGGYQCRVANVLLSTHAEPPGPPEWPPFNPGRELFR